MSPLGQPADWPQSLRSVINLMLGSAFPMFLTWGPAQSMLYNDAYSEIMGSKHPAGLGQPFADVWHELIDGLYPLLQRALAGESFFVKNMQLRMQRSSHEEDTWFTFSYSPARTESGAVAGVYCVCTETTAMVLAERHSEAERQRLQTLFSQSPGFVAVLRGPEHVFETANQAFIQLMGFRDLIGKPSAQALPEMVGQGFFKLLDDVLADGQPFVGRSMRTMISRKPDSPQVEVYLDFVFQPLLGADGLVNGIFVQGHEVTEQHRAQQALLAFSDSIPAIAWVAGADGLLLRCNYQWSAHTGQQVEAALGNGWLEFAHPEDRASMRAAWEAGKLDAKAWQSEYRLRRHDGSYRWFLARAVPQLDANGCVLNWFGTSSDIEGSRQIAQALRDADKQKDEFLATLAHELRNPLAPIRSAVLLLATQASSVASRKLALEVVSRQVGHMARLVDDLIDVSRITRGRMTLKLERVRLAAIVETAMETARPLALSKQHVLSANIAEPEAELMADPVRLTQVLANLLNNATKYTDVGGQIVLDVQTDADSFVFSVTDSGIGLSTDAIKTIFNMFSQEQSALDRSEGGLGIGLALAKGLVELHGGAVSAASVGPGHGSRFVVRIPKLANDLVSNLETNLTLGDKSAAAAAPLISAVSAIKTILLADDNHDAVDVLAELLRMDGHVVHTANDGLSAAELAAQVKPDVLVLDIGMPGLNGYELAQHIRAQPWGLRPLLVAATGWGQEGDRQKALAAGFDLHLTKPFDPLELADLIAAHKPV
ncbi:Autoinducer 2 sensor kinase/phosphatase LuxQ [Polaromonas vacuolata]|uniref:histidine kinase n=2 Tax=Polaromonas vacuolata TaxID=37448 RepID=A0A6H2HCQ8_9BURK|nr:Autoinducer 2 sensor kinase/phosphatase LuxQ [Polaromonas vacuolata]